MLAEAAHYGLFPIRYAGEGSMYQKTLDLHLPGTGQWLFTTQEYLSWSADPGKILWISGRVGAGKSVMTASLIRHVAGVNEAPVVYFFFDPHSRLDEELLFTVAQDLLSQLLPHKVRIPSAIAALQKRASGPGSAKRETLWEILLLAISELKIIYVIFDGLDELRAQSQPTDSQDHLRTLMDLNPRFVKLAATCIEHDSLANISKIERQHFTVYLSGPHTNEDLRKYVEHRLEREVNKRLPEDYLMVVRQLVAQNESCNFLWARLILDHLETRVWRTETSELLPRDIPSTLDGVYTSILSHQAQSFDIKPSFQRRVLSWASHASRPVRLPELADLLVHVGESTSIPDAESAIQNCWGCLMRIGADSTFEPAHHSITDFLRIYVKKMSAESGQESTKHLLTAPNNSFGSIHKALLVDCMDYLESGVLKSPELSKIRPKFGVDPSHYPERYGFTPDDIKKSGFLKERPFLQYAVNEWPFHLSGCDVADKTALKKVDGLLIYRSPVSAEFLHWLLLSKLDDSLRTAGYMPLHVAAFFGLDSYIEHLAVLGHNLNSRAETGWTPAMVAVNQGQVECIETLLRYGADANSTDNFGISLVHMAVLVNNPRVVDVLVSGKANPMMRLSSPIKKEIRSSAETCSWLRPVVKKTLLPLLYTSTQDLESRRQGTAVKTLIGCTPIHMACLIGSENAAAVLLGKLTRKQLRTISIHPAAMWGHGEVLSRLLDYSDIAKGINMKDGEGNTPLFYASRWQDSEAVRVLLQYGANARKLSDDRGAYRPIFPAKGGTKIGNKTPLHAWAGMGPHILRSKVFSNPSYADMESVATLLVKAGCDVNARDVDGQTALFGWTKQSVGSPPGTNHEHFVATLLSLGADATVRDNGGNTVLQGTMGLDFEDAAMSLLIGAGADINAGRDSDGANPVHLHVGAIDIDRFHAYGADFNRADMHGNTPLHYATKTFLPKPERLEKLLEVCDPTVTNKKGETCLFGAWRLASPSYSFGELIVDLMRHGLSLELKNSQGRTALLEVCREGDPDAIRTLIQAGADSTVQDGEGNSCESIFRGRSLAADSSGMILINRPRRPPPSCETANISQFSPRSLLH
jgi:ankyrin repeat protein